MSCGIRWNATTTLLAYVTMPLTGCFIYRLTLQLSSQYGGRKRESERHRESERESTTKRGFIRPPVTGVWRTIRTPIRGTISRPAASSFYTSGPHWWALYCCFTGCLLPAADRIGQARVQAQESLVMQLVKQRVKQMVKQLA